MNLRLLGYIATAGTIAIVTVWWRQHSTTTEIENLDTSRSSAQTQMRPSQYLENVPGVASTSGKKGATPHAGDMLVPVISEKSRLEGDSTNLWGIVSTNGKALDMGREAKALNDANYDPIYRELSREPNTQNQMNVSEALSSVARKISPSTSISQLACNNRMCVGQLSLQSKDDANKLLSDIANGAVGDSFSGLAMGTSEGSSGFGRFILFTGPRITVSTASAARDFTPADAPRLTPEVREAIGRAVQGQMNPAPPVKN